MKSSEKAEITAVLNVYKRPEYLFHQINRINRQTIKPKDIFIWVNQHEKNQDFDFTEIEERGWKVFRNNFNWKYHGRYAAAQLARTEYVAIFDDDTMPGTHWFENCIDTIEQYNCIAGSAGVTLVRNGYTIQDGKVHIRTGWPSKNEFAQEVDLVGHASVFKKEWLKYMWAEEPLSWENSEDIQLSALAKIHGNIRTFCPPHPADKKHLHGSTQPQFGIDENASFKNSGDLWWLQRDLAVQHYIDRGWKTVKNITKGD